MLSVAGLFDWRIALIGAGAVEIIMGLFIMMFGKDLQEFEENAAADRISVNGEPENAVIGASC